MKLSSGQQKQLRKIVATSTMLGDMRYALYQNWKLAQARQKDAFLERQKAHQELGYREYETQHYSDPKSRQEALAPANDALAAATDHERGCQDTFEQLTRQLEAINPDVDRATRLTEALLNFAGVDSVYLRPAVRGGSLASGVPGVAVVTH